MRIHHALPIALTLCAASVVSATGRTLHVCQTALPGIDVKLQFKTISDAAKIVAPGDTVLIHGGVYREKVAIEKGGTRKDPIRFEAVPGERVVVTGADKLTGWVREPGDERVYSIPWTYSFTDWSRDHTHGGPAPIGRAEQVFVAGYALRQVLSRDKMSPGTFFADLDGKRLYVWIEDNSAGYTPSDINSLPVEGSTRQMIWECKGDYIHTRGIRFRYAANHAQQGPATFSGSHDVVEDCLFERMNGPGADFLGQGIVVRRCTFQDNGIAGFTACKAHDLLVTECLVRNNNIKNYDRGWGAGGLKIVLTRHAVLERSQFLENRGVGIWFDIGNEQTEVRNCLIADNENGGLFYEISYSLHAHDNVIVGNGFAETPGAWGVTAGISLSSSPNCVVERNLFVGNAEGFSFREQFRTTPRIGGEITQEIPIWNHDQTIRNNAFAGNDVQIWGWFAAGDGRQWPKSMLRTNSPSGKPGQDLAASYTAKTPDGQPTALTLESLKLTMRDNLFSPNTGQGLINWGPSWEHHTKYTSLTDIQRELGLEQNSRVGEIPFADLQTRDYRVPTGAAVMGMSCYPKGEVPGVRLGVL